MQLTHTSNLVETQIQVCLHWHCTMKPNSRRTQRGLGARSCNSQLAAAAKGRQRGSHATMPSETAPLPLLFVTSCFLFHTRKLTVPADGLPPALLPHRAASVGARVCSDSGEVCRRWVCRCKPPVLPLPPHPAASLPLPAGAQVKLRGAAGAGLACRGGPELALPACPCRHRRPVPPRPHQVRHLTLCPCTCHDLPCCLAVRRPAVQCGQGYGPDPSGKCVRCQDRNCLWCNQASYTRCNQCGFGYYLILQTATCTVCRNGCANCEVCPTCPGGVKCLRRCAIANCDICPNTPNKCASCGKLQTGQGWRVSRSAAQNLIRP